MAKKQPGTMLYFDIRPCLKRLSTQEKGILFEAILDYGEFGAVPELEGQLGVAWDFIQPRLDRDRERYGEQVVKKKYAVYVREAKRQGEVPLPFDVWKVSDDNETYQVISDDIGWYPTTTPTTTPSTTPSPSTTPTSTPTGSGRQSRPKTEEQKFEDMRKQRMRMLQGGK